MIAVISPAKSMDLPLINFDLPYSKPIFTKEIKAILAVVKKYKSPGLMELMSISEKLAKLNVQRYKTFDFDFNYDAGAAPAITSFIGEVYIGLNARTFNAEELQLANSKISIISGFYGLLNPLDLILPYRLEMSTPLSIGKNKNLYQFWGSKIAQQLKIKMTATSSEYIINLASDEYFKAIKPYIDPAKIITINFKEEKAGKWTFISFNAKKARGMVCNYIVKNQLNNPTDLLLFNYENYIYNEALSNENEWIFTRKFIPVGERK